VHAVCAQGHMPIKQQQQQQRSDASAGPAAGSTGGI
jgi:hypothetical protein